MKKYELVFFRNGHKYLTTVVAHNIASAIDVAENICEISKGNIVSIKEVK